MNNRLVPERNKDLIYLADIFLGSWLDLFSNTHIEMPKETQELMQKHTNVTYIGLHKSAWETLAIPHAIKSRGGQVPYIVMGEGVIQKKIVLYLLEKAGVFRVNREGPKKETAFGLLDQIADVLQHNDSLLIFPEGKKSKTGEPEKFKTTVFQGIVQATRKEPQHVISVNIDYSHIIEEQDYFYPEGNAPRRPIRDRIRWLQNIGDAYISFSKPVTIASGYDRKSLTEKIWKDSIDLIKIQPINIVSTVMEEYLKRNADKITNDKEIVGEEIYEEIGKLMQRLEPQKSKFRNLRIDDDPIKVAQQAMIPFSLEKKQHYSLYAGYIKPYTSKI